MTDFDHEIISRGNCMICGKPIDIDNIFLCSECMKQKTETSEQTCENSETYRQGLNAFGATLMMSKTFERKKHGL